MLSTFARLWIDKYHQSAFHSSMHYTSIAIGITISERLGSRQMDVMYKKLGERYNGIGKPEFRAPYLDLGFFLKPAGLF